MKKYFKYLAMLMSFVMVFSLTGFSATQTIADIMAANNPASGDIIGAGSPSAGDNSGDTGAKSPSAGDNSGDIGANSPSAGDNSGDTGEIHSGNYTYIINEDGTLTLTKCVVSEDEADIILPSEIDGKKVTVIGRKSGELLLDGCPDYKKIIIPEGVTEVDTSAFIYTYYSTFVFPKSVTKIDIGYTGAPEISFIHNSYNIVYGYKDSVVQKAAEKDDVWAFFAIDEPDLEYGDFLYRVNSDNTITITGFSKSMRNDGMAEVIDKVEVPEEIDGKKVTCIGPVVFINTGIVELVIPKSVNKISSSAIGMNDKLEKVTILGRTVSFGKQDSICPSYNYNAGKKVIIKGYSNTSVEEYALNNDFDFESLGTYEEPTEPDVPSEPDAKPEEKPIDSSVMEEINSGEKVVEKTVEAGSYVPADVVTAAIEKGAKLVLEVTGANGKPVAKYTIDGSKFDKAPDANLKLDITCGVKNEVTDSVKEQLQTEDNSLFLCSFAHSGELNGELAVTVYPENYDKGAELKLFYYNEATGKVEDMNQTVKVAEDGSVTFTVTHFSSYLLVKADDIKADTQPNEPETQPSAPSGIAVGNSAITADSSVVTEKSGKDGYVNNDVFAALIKDKKTLVVDVMDADGKLAATFTIDGSTFNSAPDSLFRLNVEFNANKTAADKAKEMLNAEDKDILVCSFDTVGYLNGWVRITVNADGFEAGTALKLYYFNEELDTVMDKGQTVNVKDDGTVTFAVDHFSSYVLVKSNDTKTETEPETGDTGAESGTSEAGTSESGSAEITSPSTGFAAPVALIGVMLMSCAAAGAAGVSSRRKK